MANASRTEVMDASVENVYKVLTDYSSYPEFMDGVSSVDIIESNNGTAKVKYDLNVIKVFSYVLNLTEVENESVSWEFDEGDIFSTNSGSWELKDLGDGTTEVTYNIELEIKIKMMGTGLITKKLLKTSLPSMMKQVEQRAQDL
jgi:ribosome-associated toxin RatA of RatAB toxin-antitoxin module